MKVFVISVIENEMKYKKNIHLNIILMKNRKMHSEKSQYLEFEK
jgi:hypothetical protein